MAFNFILRQLEKMEPQNALIKAFEIENRLYKLEGQLSVAYDGGIHTKHRHIKYHDFFIENIDENESVIDVGCGNGALTNDIAKKTRAKVMGIDFSKENIRFAKEHYKRANLEFIEGDVLKIAWNITADVVVLSNIIEHIEDRVVFLEALITKIKPKKVLIRTPIFERDWRVPLKKELGVEYFLDPGHFIEYRFDDFVSEMKEAGLKIESCKIRWGEIWAVCEPHHSQEIKLTAD